MIFSPIFYDLFFGTILIYIIYKTIKIVKNKLKYRWIQIKHENVPHWVKRCWVPHAGFYRLVNGSTWQYKIEGTFDGTSTTGWGEGVNYYKRLKK